MERACSRAGAGACAASLPEEGPPVRIRAAVSRWGVAATRWEPPVRIRAAASRWGVAASQPPRALQGGWLAPSLVRIQGVGGRPPWSAPAVRTCRQSMAARAQGQAGRPPWSALELAVRITGARRHPGAPACRSEPGGCLRQSIDCSFGPARWREGRPGKRAATLDHQSTAHLIFLPSPNAGQSTHPARRLRLGSGPALGTLLPPAPAAYPGPPARQERVTNRKNNG